MTTGELIVPDRRSLVREGLKFLWMPRDFFRRSAEKERKRFSWGNAFQFSFLSLLHYQRLSRLADWEKNKRFIELLFYSLTGTGWAVCIFCTYGCPIERLLRFHGELRMVVFDWHWVVFNRQSSKLDFSLYRSLPMKQLHFDSRTVVDARTFEYLEIQFLQRGFKFFIAADIESKWLLKLHHSRLRNTLWGLDVGKWENNLQEWNCLSGWNPSIQPKDACRKTNTRK